MIKIPEKSLMLLSENEYLASIVYMYIEQYMKYISRNGFREFFPEYTDHGFLHTQEILNLCEYLVSDATHGRPNSWESVTSQDIAVLIFAVILHDIGMNFTKKDAALLIVNRERKIQGIDNESWSDLWQKFLDESQRWDGRQLKFVYGEDYQSLGERWIKRIPDLNENFWDKADKKLIGEFLRRHHGRIAHEVAIMGIPSQPDILNLSIFFQDKYEHIPHIAGTIARSHVVSIRQALSFTEPYSPRETKGIHPAYLMTLLRIADSMHIHSERAPGGKAALQKRTSPISKREYSAHQAINDVRQDTEPDPEALFVEVIPDKLHQVETYFRIKEWLTNLQTELDSSWAILGEVYGRYELNNLWLTIRRVGSNLYSQSIVSLLPFITMKASFGASNANFLKLLVKPLYGERPEIGIRELLQNAIDAVREFDCLKKMHLIIDVSDLPILDEKYPDADITINYCSRESFKGDTSAIPENWQYWIEVCDRGVGMTPQTVAEYFLKAGSTFRNSDYWKRTFLGEHGNSKILRSGRFGVGALAAFLIGNEMQMITRHFSEKTGISFVAGLDDEYIQLNKVNVKIGTSIRIKCEKEVFDSLTDRFALYHQRWYYLSWPLMVIKKANEYVYHSKDNELEDDNQEYSDDYFIPDQDSILPSEWRRIKYPGFADIHWCYDKYRGTRLYCNGIEVPIDPNKLVWSDHKFETRSWMILRRKHDLLTPEIPTVSVFDPDGNLNLNLARDSLTTESYPFDKALLRSVYLDLIAHSLICGPNCQPNIKDFTKLKKLTYPGLHDDARHQSTQWIYTKDGFTIADSYIVRLLGLKRIIIMTTKPNKRWLPGYKCADEEGLLLFRDDMKTEDITEDCLWPINISRSLRDTYYLSIDVMEKFKILKLSFLISSSMLSLIERLIGKSLRKSPDHKIKSLADGKFFIIHNNEDGMMNNENALIQIFSQKNIVNHRDDFGMISIVELDTQSDLVPSLLSRLWIRILGQPYIPYDNVKRRELIEKCKPKICEQIDSWATYLALQQKEPTNSPKEKGVYPNFSNANEVKRYLRENGIARKVIVRKYRFPWMDTFSFLVYVQYERDELRQIYPQIPETGDPFVGIDIEPDKLPEYRRIVELLKDSNTSVEWLGPRREEDDSELIDDLFGNDNHEN